MILAVSPHPDDAEIGCGAYLCAVDAVMYVAVSGGMDPQRLVEATTAARLLDVATVWGSAVDTRAAAHATTMRHDLEALLDHYQPSTVLLPPLGDTHQDHRAVRAAAMSALRRKPVTILEYETPSAPPGWAADHWVAVGPDHVDTAMKAIAAHQSQAHAAYADPALYAARLTVAGARVGLTAADSYRTVRCVTRQDQP